MGRGPNEGAFKLNYNRVGALLYTDAERVSHARTFSNSPSHRVHEAY